MLGEKLVIKMWETIADKGIGSLLAPWQILREADARTEARRREIVLLAVAEKEALEIKNGQKFLTKDLIETKDIVKRIEPTFDYENIINTTQSNITEEAIREEINLNKVVVIAEEELANDSQEPPERDIDTDWLYRWKENVSKVSVEDLQQIWGKVLAGEIKSPGTYSLRTLEFLKNISQEEAHLIEKVAQYNISGHIYYSKNVITEDNDPFFEEHDLPFSDFMRLQELGILNGVSSFGLKVVLKSDIKDVYQKVLISYEKALLITHNDKDKEILTPSYSLTQLGKEVLSLGSFKDNDEYLKTVGKRLLNEGVKVSFGNWNRLSERHGEFSLIEEVIENIQE